MSTNIDHAALLERFNLDREAARTEAGTLYEATEKVSLRKVTIEIANDLDDDARLAFERDAMISQRLEGEHVLRVLDVGALIDGTPFVVREPALGSLANDVTTRGPLPTAEAVAWTLEVCEALAEAHTKGLAHGDIRAETVFLALDAAGNPIAKVRWTSKAKADGQAREDVARDIAGAALLLRYLITGQTDYDDDAVKTLPTELGHAVAKATSKNEEARYRNIGELASTLARFAPPDHQSARNIAFLMSRAGIVGAPVAIPISQRMTTPNAHATVNASASPARSVPPPLPPAARRQPVGPQLRTEPGLNEEWFAAPTIPRRVSEVPPPPARRSGAGAAVALLLIGATLGGTLWLYKSGDLPQWSGTAPPSDEGKMEPVSRTEITSGLMDTTVMTPPPALEGVVIDPNAKPVTTTQDDIEVTESAPAAKPETTAAPAPAPAATMDSRPMEKKPQVGSAPAVPSTNAKAKTQPTTTDEAVPAKPWAGTGAPATTSAPAPSADDTSSPSAPSTSPTTSPTTEPTSPSTSPTTSPSTEPTAPSKGEPRVNEDPGF